MVGAMGFQEDSLHDLSCIPARAGSFPALGPAQLRWLSTALGQHSAGSAQPFKRWASTALGKHKPCAGPAQPQHSASTVSNLA